MPKRSDPEIVALQKALDENDPDVVNKNGRQLLRERPELKRKYGNQLESFDKYFGRMKRSYLIKNEILNNNDNSNNSNDNSHEKNKQKQAKWQNKQQRDQQQRQLLQIFQHHPSGGQQQQQQHPPQEIIPNCNHTNNIPPLLLNNNNNWMFSSPQIAPPSYYLHHPLRRSVHLRNTETNCTKDLIVPVSEDTMCYDAIYNNATIQRAKLRVWTKTTAEEIKQNKKEIQLAIVPNNYYIPNNHVNKQQQQEPQQPQQAVFHRFTIQDLKTTSTKDLFAILPTTALSSIKKQEIINEEDDHHPTNILHNSNSNNNDNNKSTTTTPNSEFNPLHIHIEAVDNMNYYELDTQQSDYEEI